MNLRFGADAAKQNLVSCEQQSQEINGIILVDKESGWTSHDVCAFIRKKFRIKKVGHAGTLDPMATGLLIVLLGHSTKRSNELTACDKEYSGVIRLGTETDSYDAQGKVVAEREWNDITEDNIREAFEQFRGTLEQKPPMGAALKHIGVRLYKLARAGKVVERALRTITVYEFRIDKILLPRIYFYAKVSKGTYLRTLVHDLGQGLGCGAILEDLRRIKAGKYEIAEAISIQELRDISASDFREKVKRFNMAALSA